MLHVLASDVSLVGLGFRLILSLAVVLGMIASLVWLARRRGGGFGFSIGTATPGDISVCAREQLDRNNSVALLRVGERAMLVGVSEGAVSVLAEGDDLLPEPEPAPVEGTPVDLGTVGESRDDRTSSVTGSDGPVPAGMNVIEALREWSVRRS